MNVLYDVFGRDMTSVFKKILCGWLLVLSVLAVAESNPASEQEEKQEEVSYRDGQTYGTGV